MFFVFRKAIARLLGTTFAPPLERTVRRNPQPRHARPHRTRLDVLSLEDRTVPTAVVSVVALVDETDEGDDENPAIVEFTRTGSTAAALTVTITVTEGAESDIEDLGTTVQFPIGKDTVDVPVVALADAEVEDDEMVDVGIYADEMSDYTADSKADTASVTIHDMTAVISITDTSDGAEGGADGMFELTRTGGDLSKPLTIQILLTGAGAETATEDYDFEGVGSTVTFEAESATAVVDVVVIDDTEYDPNEGVGLTVLMGDNYVDGASDEITITDDEIDPMDPDHWVYWTGAVDDDAANPLNWVTNQEVTPLAAPGADDAAVFTSGAPDCANLGGTIGELRIGSGYEGTVTVEDDLTVRDLVLTSATAALDQAAATGTDITVSGAMLWTNGTINSTANDATVNISAWGIIAPASAGTVTTGSTLIFAGADEDHPKTTTIQPGTVQLNNAAGAVVGFGAQVRVEVLVSSPGTINGYMEAGSKGIAINSGGKFEVRGIGNFSTNMTVQNAGGLFKLNGQVTATLSDGDKTTADYGQVTSNDAKLHIVNGSNLVTSHGTVIEKGSVFLIMNPALAAGAQTATITGGFWLRAGDIVFGEPITIGGTLRYGTFTVTGDVTWRGGRYLPSVDCSDAGIDAKWANKWITTGTMTISPVDGQPAPQIVPNPLQLPQGQQAPTDVPWEVVNAGQIQGPNPTLPTNWQYQAIVDSNTNNVVGWRMEPLAPVDGILNL